TTDGIVIKEVDKNVKTKKGNLPETGDSTNKNVLFGGALLATAGIALMYRRNN
ncbi:LPXTG cell wall anchor domain-containing protein, partial [Listeria seeligeri]|nr:LPXTG cell wall anchor domain-containing protein [Listeria seeligeri]